MRAAIFNGTDRLEVTDVPAPEPGGGEALVKVAGCGLCHTDLHYLDHGVKTFKDPPLILGHEISGTVTATGAGVSRVREGDRVLIPAVLSCGKCSFCRSGRENLCNNLRMLGNHIDGGYAEYVAVPAEELIPVPASLPLVESAVIADALSTPYHAVKQRGRVRPGDTVAVIGCGGVGLNVVQCCVVSGASVIAIDINAEHLKVAEELGASHVFNPDEVERLDKTVRKLTGGGVDVAFEAIGNPKTIETAYGLLRRGGRLCVIGYAAGQISISAAKLMFFELEVVGSLGCGGGEYPEIIRLVEAGRLKLDPVVSGTVPLEQINDGLDKLRRHEGVRWVVVP